MSEVSAEDVARVEAILRDDIKWAATQPGVGFAPQSTAEWDGDQWSQYVRYDGRACGVCAIGAHVLRHQVESVDDNDVCSAARSLAVSERFVMDIWDAIMDEPEDRDDDSPLPGIALGWRLRDYGDSLGASCGE
jgi:hypothetical protein